MSEKYPYKPPADAKEWTCPKCGCDLLYCGCKQDEDFAPTLHARAPQEPAQPLERNSFHENCEGYFGAQEPAQEPDRSEP